MTTYADVDYEGSSDLVFPSASWLAVEDPLLRISRCMNLHPGILNIGDFYCLGAKPALVAPYGGLCVVTKACIGRSRSAC